MHGEQRGDVSGFGGLWHVPLLLQEISLKNQSDKVGVFQWEDEKAFVL